MQARRYAKRAADLTQFKVASVLATLSAAYALRIGD